MPRLVRKAIKRKPVINTIFPGALISIERPADTGILSAGDLTVADGVVSFTGRLDRAGEYFAMQGIKFRGMKRLMGLHSYAISEAWWLVR